MGPENANIRRILQDNRLKTIWQDIRSTWIPKFYIYDIDMR